MKKIKSIIMFALVLVCGMTMLTACGGGGGKGDALADISEVKGIMTSSDTQGWEGVYCDLSLSTTVSAGGFSVKLSTSGDSYSKGSTVEDIEAYSKVKATIFGFSDTSEIYIKDKKMYNVATKTKTNLTMFDFESNFGMYDYSQVGSIVGDFDNVFEKAYRKDLSNGGYKITLDLSDSFFTDAFVEEFGNLGMGVTVLGSGYISYTFDGNDNIVEVKMSYNLSGKVFAEGSTSKYKLSISMTIKEHTGAIPSPRGFNDSDYTLGF